MDASIPTYHLNFNFLSFLYVCMSTGVPDPVISKAAITTDLISGDPTTDASISTLLVPGGKSETKKPLEPTERN